MRFFYLFIILFISTVLNVNGLTPDLTVNIPMRDGLEIPTDLYLPPSKEKAPCILLRIPAGRNAQPWQSYAALSQLGYVVAIQDTRSTLDLTGKTFPYLTDGWGKLQDGYDTIDWLAKSEYTNGNIGTFGFSAGGITQLLLAPTAPAALKCQYIGIAPASLYHHAIYPGGQLYKNQIEGWLGLYAKDTGVLGHIIGQPFYNHFWTHLDSVCVAHRVQVPGLHYGGWYDTFIQGTIDGYVSRQNNGGDGARGTQKLLIGPWTHYFPLSTKLGDFEVPKNGLQPPLDLSPQRWFDHYLKDIDNGIEKEPLVTYYVMGPFDLSPSKGNVWRTSNIWPIPSKETPLYLTSQNKIDLRKSPEEKQFLYQYNPENPVPTIGGRNLFLESGPKDQSSLENRSDVILFTSEPFAEDVEVTGHLIAKLFFCSDQKDTDVVVKVTDVYPDGKSILITDGLHRVAYAQCVTGESFQNQPQEIEVDLGSTSMVFAKGHCLRLAITSSNYPRYEKNLNIGFLGHHKEESVSAKNCLLVGEKYPSRIILPIVE